MNGRVVPATVPATVPFISTTPLGSEITTGPVTALPVCVGVHVITAVTLLTAMFPRQVPVRLVAGSVGLGRQFVTATRGRDRRDQQRALVWPSSGSDLAGTLRSRRVQADV